MRAIADMYAPVCLSTYARPAHLAQTLEALRKNVDADKHELFVFSDGPKPGDENKVAAVRKYLRSVDGFKKITLFERTENDRVRNNRGGMEEILDRYGRIIFLEEDIVTSPIFLSYMNQALLMYESNQRVMSITGYCPPISLPSDYSYDAFFLRRFNAWGFGIWKDRFEEILKDTRMAYDEIMGDRGAIREFCRFGSDMIRMAKLDAAGRIDALDVKAMLTQFFSGKYTLYPVGSLVRNVGFDGSGVHCRRTNRFDSKVVHEKDNFRLPGSVFEDPRIVSAHRRFRSDGILVRILRLMITQPWHK